MPGFLTAVSCGCGCSCGDIVTTAATIASDQHNWAIPSVAGQPADVVRLPVTSASSLTGVVKTITSQRVRLHNTGTATLTIVNQSASSSAANRITTATGGNLALTPGMFVDLLYNEAAASWVVTGGSATAYDQTTATATFSANEDDYDLTTSTGGPAPVQLWNVTDPVTVSGIEPPDGLATITIVNTGVDMLTLAHQSTSSSAANRIITPHGAALVVPPGASARLVRDPAAARWRIPGGSAVNYPGAVYLPEMSAPSTPPTDSVVLYAKADGGLYSKADTGAEVTLSGPPATPASGIAGLTSASTWRLANTITHADLTDADTSQDVTVCTLPAKACIHGGQLRTKTVGSGGGVGSLVLEVLVDTTVTGNAGNGMVANDLTGGFTSAPGTGTGLFGRDWAATTAVALRVTADVNVADLTGGEWEVYLLLSTLG